MLRFRTATLCAALGSATLLPCASVLAVDDVNFGTLFTLTDTSTAPNGAWSWFEDERAIIDTNFAGGPLLLVSSVSDGGGAEEGDIDLLWRNLNTGVQGEFELNDTLQADDHDSASLYIRPDGRYLAMYSRHGNDQLTRWRVSTNPNDPTAWGAEQTLSNGAGTTYNNTYYLPNDNGGAGRLYNFTRAVNFDPNVQISNDDGTTWSNVGKLLTEGGGGDRPYVRYASDGDKIHLIATERHPRNFANNIFHGYVQDGQLFDTDGNVIDSNIFNASGVSPSNLTQVFANGSSFGGTTMNRAWTTNIEMDDTGNPVAIFTARANDDDDDHRFFYARHNGTDWVVNEMAKAGGFLYSPENDYTGLASIDPNNPDVVYMSSEVDPITGIATTSGKYELYQGITDDFGASWSWTAITENSTVDNLRPLVPEWDEANTALVWMRGNYNTFQDWDSEVVGITFENVGFKIWDGGIDSNWDIATTANWQSGGAGAVYDDGDQVTFNDSASSFTVNIVGSGGPANTTFNNSANAYTVTGNGIGGTGQLRVTGGGTVTLNNGANTYAGDTLISDGTLALQNSATLGGTAHINVGSGGTFDVTGVTGGAYTLSGQVLTVDGDVNGNINATAGSTVHVNSNNSMNGNLVANASTVDGLGTVNGDLTGQSGAVIQVGAAGFTPEFTQAATTYVDATLTNTTRANGAALVGGGVDYLDLTGGGSVNSNDDAWDYRAFGNGPGGGTVFSSNNNGGEDAPALAVTIDGLTPGQEVEVFAYSWGAENANWRFRASLIDPGSGEVGEGWNTDHFNASSFSSTDAVTNHSTGGLNGGPLSTSTGGDPAFENGGYFSNGVGVVETEEGNRELYQAALGMGTADGNGEIIVYVDDLANTSSGNRTFFDGVGYRLNLPSSVVPQTNTLTVTGDVTLESGSLLALDIYNPDALDLLDVTGVFNAGGTLDVDLVSGAPIPQLGDSFDLLDFASATGSFDTLDLPALSPGLFWDASALLTTGVLSVTDTAPFDPADLDQDGDVDDADFGIAFAAFTGPNNGPSSNPAADLDNDGDVDDADFGIAFAAFTGPNPANVPEPTSLALLGLGGLLVARRQHGRRIRRERAIGGQFLANC